MLIRWAMATLSIACCVLACASEEERSRIGSEAPQVVSAIQTARFSQAVPKNYAAPRHVLSATAAIVDGIVSTITETYSDELGPRTVLTVDVGSVLEGTLSERQIELWTFGGRRPDGRSTWSSMGTNFVQGARYIFFLRGGTWDRTPFTTSPLRVEVIDGREVLVGRDGRPLTAVRPGGFEFGKHAIFDDGKPPCEVRTQADRIQNLPQDALVGTLNLVNLRQLINEVMKTEDVMPQGTFSQVPVAQGTNWAMRPASPHASQSSTTGEEP